MAQSFQLLTKVVIGQDLVPTFFTVFLVGLPQKGKQYFDSMSDWGVTVRVRPERWLAVDYSKS